jgi:hypothetical protein
MPSKVARWAVFLSFAALVVACDRFDRVVVRNNESEPLTVAWQLPGGDERERSPLAPGTTRNVGYIGGPPDPPRDITVKAFDTTGALVYCRRFSPSEYQKTSTQNPIGLKPGDLRCS